MSQHTPRRRSGFLADSSFIRFYLWRYRKWIGLGLSALILVDVIDVLPPVFLKKAVDIAVEKKPIHDLLEVAIAYLVVSGVQSVCRYAWRMYLIRASVYAGRDLRSLYTHHLFGLSVSFFDRHRMGDLMSLATNDVESVRMVIGTGILVFADALFYILTVPVAMYFLSPKLTLLACLPLPLIPFLVLKNETAVHERFEKVQECFGRISAMTQESLNGVRVTKAFAKEDIQIERMKKLGQEYVHLNLKLARIQTAIGPVMDLSMSIGMVLLLFVGGRSLIEGGVDAITLGTFVAFQRYIQKMVWPMAALGMAINYYQRSVSSSYRLKNIFAISSDVKSPAHPIQPQIKKGEIEFRNLSFAFPGSTKLVLKNVHLKIEPGERVAFVGGIGSGKSALLSLIPRLYPVQPGMLRIDGVDVNEWSVEELRRQVGYVSQEVFLFSETVKENVAFGLHSGSDISSSLVEDSAQLAMIHEDILSFSSHYQTRLGERGINLSGGQKQRLTIARALAKRPLILVLDDALSSVDVQTEEKILNSLRSRPERNTEVIAAHRISTVKNSDRIVVFKEGEIAEIGTHNQLIRSRSSDYWKFYEQQQLKEDLEKFQDGLDREIDQLH